MILIGIGATPLEKFIDLYTTAAVILEKILVHARTCDTTPVDGNASLGALMAKPTWKKGMAGQRLIHVCCPFLETLFRWLDAGVENKKEKME